MRWWWLVLVAAGCGGADGTGETGSLCVTGCTETMAAACENGPADEATCVSDCEDLRVGSCGAAYEDVLDCSAGEPVTCDANHIPTVAACESEFLDFTDCLSGT
ncbi:MAG: hypothetical protein KC621_17630 [Myxococcales bacterium]|nr:hypothetical protein [Myxococcales bacterium]